MSEQTQVNLAASDKQSYYQQKWFDDSDSEFEATTMGSSRQKIESRDKKGTVMFWELDSDKSDADCNDSSDECDNDHTSDSLSNTKLLQIRHGYLTIKGSLSIKKLSLSTSEYYYYYHKRRN